MTFEEILEIVNFLRKTSNKNHHNCSYVIEDVIRIKMVNYSCFDEIQHDEKYLEVWNRGIHGCDVKLLSIHEENDIGSYVYANIIYTFLEKGGYLIDLED